MQLGDYARRNNIPWLGQIASIAGCMYGYCAAAAFGMTQSLHVAMIAGKFGHGFISAGLGSLAGMAGGDEQGKRDWLPVPSWAVLCRK